MDFELFEQAFRNAVFSAKPAWRPILWAFLPLFRSHLSLAVTESWLLNEQGRLDSDK